MAERTVSVKLIADAAAYVREMDEAVRKTQDSTRTIEQQLQQQAQAYQMVGAAAIGVGVASLAGVTAAVVAYSQFDAAMSNVQAATGESTSNMEDLSEAALQAGADTVYSATEAAGAIEELSKAGVSTADILDGALSGSLDLAAAGEISVAEAAETAASAMTQFGLAGDDVTHIADLLAAAAGNAQGGVSDMGAALSQSGLVASQMGLSIEETTGTLAAFASAGLMGSDAGTSFRAMLLRLANPTGEVREVMDELGLSFYDAQGQFIGMEGVAAQLTTQMSDLTQEQRNAALATIFGQDAIRAASILYEEGATGIAEWTARVDDSGYAAEQAAARLDNLQGDLEALGGAFETLLINLGAAGDGPLRGAVQWLDDIVSAAAEAPPQLQALVLGAMAVVGAVALVGGTAMVALPKIVEFRGALATLTATSGGAAGSVGRLAGFLGSPWTVAIAAAGASLLVLNDYMESTRATGAELEAMLRGGADAAQLFAEAQPDSLRVFDFDSTSTAEFEDWINRIALKGEDFWSQFDSGNIALDNSGFTGALQDLDELLGGMDFEGVQDGFLTLVEDMNLSEDAAARLLDAMPGVRDALLEQAAALDLDVTAADGSIDSHALLAVMYGETGEAAEATSAAFDASTLSMQSSTEAALELLEAQREVVDAFFASQDATAAYEQSIDDITAALTDGDNPLVPAIDSLTGSFDMGEQSGRDAAAMMQGLVTSANDLSAQLLTTVGSSEEMSAEQAAMREQIYQAGIEMGLSEDQARDYANMLVEIPDSVFTQAQLATSAAEAAMAAFLNKRRVVFIDVQAGAMPSISASTFAGGNVVGFDGGGRIPGPYIGRDDRFGFDQHGNVWGLAGDEWIINPESSSKYDRILRQINDGTFVGYDSGGRVASAAPSYAYASSPVVNITTPAALAPSVQVDVHGGGMSPSLVGAIAGQEVADVLRRVS